jgi:hypothetical protein
MQGAEQREAEQSKRGAGGRDAKGGAWDVQCLQVMRGGEQE